MNDSSHLEECITAPSGAEGVKRILTGLLNELEGYEKGVRTGEDVKCLHNYRVVLRRARVAVSQFRRILPPDAHAYLTGELRWLGRESGALRDYDVYLEALESYQEWLPAELHSSLRIFREHLLENRNTEQEKFTRAISENRYHQFIAWWRKFSGEDQADGETSGNPDFAAVCRRRIWRIYRRMLREGALICKDSPAAALHELRKDGKKLRYLLEFYSQYPPGGKTGKLTSRLRQLLAILGKHQDAEVQAEALIQFSQRPPPEDADANSFFLGLGMLIGHLNALKIQARKDFEAGFQKFSSDKNRRRFRSLCGRRSLIRAGDR
jgi:CHAD domain-containing protein